MIPAGDRDRLIIFERAGPSTDDGYTTQPGAFAEHSRAWAKVLFGTGQERREAAQEQATIAATFMVNWSPTLAEVGPGDRIVFDGAWDIVSVAPVGRHDELHVTAARSA